MLRESIEFGPRKKESEEVIKERIEEEEIKLPENLERQKEFTQKMLSEEAAIGEPAIKIEIKKRLEEKPYIHILSKGEKSKRFLREAELASTILTFGLGVSQELKAVPQNQENQPETVQVQEKQPKKIVKVEYSHYEEGLHQIASITYVTINPETGKRIAEKTVLQTDTNGDGIIDYLTIKDSEFNEKGEEISTLYEKVVNDGKRLITRNRAFNTYEYDEGGNLKSRLNEIDSDGDGEINSRFHVTYKYNERGNKISELDEYDANADGIIDEQNFATYEYDDYGDIRKSINAKLEIKEGGSIKITTTDEFKEGKRIRRSIDTSSRPDRRVEERIIYSYGKFEDPISTVKEVFIYDQVTGQLKEKQIDNNNDGRTDIIEVYTEK